MRDGAALKLSGPVTMETAGSLASQGRALLTDGAAKTTALDFAGATVIDSAAVSLVLELARTAAAAGHKLSVANAPASLQSLGDLYSVRTLWAAS